MQVGKIALGSSSAAYRGAGGLSGVEEKCYLHSTYIYIYIYMYLQSFLPLEDKLSIKISEISLWREIIGQVAIAL